MRTISRQISVIDQPGGTEYIETTVGPARKATAKSPEGFPINMMYTYTK